MTESSITDTAHLRQVFGAFPSGVVALAALLDGVPVGLAASSFTSVSLHPPLVSICIAHTSATWPVLRRSTHLGISVLAADQEEACRRLSAKNSDRFTSLSWRVTYDGAILLDGASAWLECMIENEIPAGDHDVVVFRVHSLAADPIIRPLVFHASQFRRLEH